MNQEMKKITILLMTALVMLPFIAAAEMDSEEYGQYLNDPNKLFDEQGNAEVYFQMSLAQQNQILTRMNTDTVARFLPYVVHDARIDFSSRVGDVGISRAEGRYVISYQGVNYPMANNDNVQTVQNCLLINGVLYSAQGLGERGLTIDRAETVLILDFSGNVYNLVGDFQGSFVYDKGTLTVVGTGGEVTGPDSTHVNFGASESSVTFSNNELSSFNLAQGTQLRLPPKMGSNAEARHTIFYVPENGLNGVVLNKGNADINPESIVGERGGALVIDIRGTYASYDVHLKPSRALTIKADESSSSAGDGYSMFFSADTAGKFRLGSERYIPGLTENINVNYKIGSEDFQRDHPDHTLTTGSGMVGGTQYYMERAGNYIKILVDYISNLIPI